MWRMESATKTRGCAKIWKIPSNRIGGSFKLKEKVRIETKSSFKK